MSDKPKKLWCGSAKPIDNPKFEPGSFKVHLCLSDIPEHTTYMRGNDKMCTLDMFLRQEPSPKGMTHGLAVDTWKPPEPRQDAQAPPPPQAPPPAPGPHVETDDSIDEIPF